MSSDTPLDDLEKPTPKKKVIESTIGTSSVNSDLSDSNFKLDKMEIITPKKNKKKQGGDGGLKNSLSFRNFQISQLGQTLKKGFKIARGDLGFLPEEDQSNHQQKYRHMTFYKRKAPPRNLMDHQNTRPRFANNGDVNLESGFIDDDFGNEFGKTKSSSNSDQSYLRREKKKKRNKNQSKNEKDKALHKEDHVQRKKNKKKKKKRKKKRRRAQKHDEYWKAERKPYFIYFVSFLDVLLLIISIWKNGGLESLKKNPWFGPSMEILVDMGAKEANKIKDGEYWRFFTAMFLHVGVIHLLMNLAFQIRVGAQLEKIFGPTRMIIIYIISGIGGNLLSAIFLPSLVSVGASSSLYGLVGILFCDLFQNWKEIKNPKSSLFKLIIMVVVSLCVGLFPAIDNFAHVGGLIAGSLMGIIILPYIHFGKARKFLVLIAIPLLLLYFFLCYYFFFKDVDPNGWCPKCTYLNCLPVKDWCSSTNGTNQME
ncbi:rhomboid-like protein [Anaeramoeba flamelloides]|uniref:rhomboid protease n=1 Tax=Anaeramoeba flamelloides TaxID=1746091 RepID=A0ABQ8Z690_9EUKA|nr:rhomboid-like protein [Anaeramoeba flamelloides]